MIEPTHKTCKLCGETKPVDEIARRNEGKLSTHCKPCYNRRARERGLVLHGLKGLRARQNAYNARRDPRIRKSNQLRSKYGIDMDDWEGLAESQDNRCAICSISVDDITTPAGALPLAVDHSHVTGRIRGLLCTDCNLALGRFHDDVDILQRAIQYLEAGGVPLARQQQHWVAASRLNSQGWQA